MHTVKVHIEDCFKFEYFHETLENQYQPGVALTDMKKSSWGWKSHEAIFFKQGLSLWIWWILSQVLFFWLSGELMNLSFVEWSLFARTAMRKNGEKTLRRWWQMRKWWKMRKLKAWIWEKSVFIYIKNININQTLKKNPVKYCARYRWYGAWIFGYLRYAL